MSLQNKNILITGASGGIGSAVCAELVRRGARVHAIGRTQALLDELDKRYRITENGGTVLCADISTANGRSAIQSVCNTLSRPLDMLINCAGINDFGLFGRQDDSVIEQMIAVNVTGPMLLTRTLLDNLHRRGARIINIGSTFGSIGYPGFVAYSATKFALRGFSEALRRELAGSEIRVDYLAPRATQTSLNDQRITRMNERLGVATDKPEKVAAAVLRIIEKGRPVTRFLGWPERLFVKINNILPGLVDAALFRQLETITHYATHPKP